MPYDQKRRMLVGEAVQEEISPRQQRQIGRYVKRMRVKPTEGERALYAICDKIGRRSNGRTRYVKQRPFLMAQHVSFIADAYFKSFRLCIEVDGGSHSSEEAKARDAWRDELLLKSKRITTLRLTNKDVLADERGVMERIVHALAESPYATPSYRKYITELVHRYGGYDWHDWKKIC